MPGLGPFEIAVVVGLFLVVVLGAFGGRTTKLVLQRLTVHEAVSGEAAPAIDLAGRQQGLISFLLTLVGISPVTDFRVTTDEVLCNSTSLFGRQNQSVPLHAVSSVAAGVRKPVGYLFVAFLFAFIGVFGGLGVLWREGFVRFVASFLVCGAFAALFIWLYAINKRFFVSIYTQGGPPILLSLKPNVIEGVPLDLDRALQVVKIIRDRVVTNAVPATAVPPFAAVLPSPDGHQGTRSSEQMTDPSPSPFPAYEFDDIPEPAVTAEPETLLQQARDLIKRGKRQEAIVVLRDIVARFPRSTEAGVAKSTLEKAGISA